MSINPRPTEAASSVETVSERANPWPLPPSFPSPNRDGLKADPWVRALFATSYQAATKKRSRRLRQSGALAPTAPPGTQGNTLAPSPYSLTDAAPQLANPLAPLRDRDRQALAGFFADDQMSTIEADILHRLSALVPEPAWEIEPYDFLREFL
ncbi:MAG: hypothetical protein AAFW95_09300 [Cyanobacteria bacterium J06638_6]